MLVLSVGSFQSGVVRVGQRAGLNSFTFRETPFSDLGQVPQCYSRQHEQQLMRVALRWDSLELASWW